jgi:hypothetical protein
MGEVMSNLQVTQEDPIQRFQNSVKDKIKANIADALPDDVIAALFQRSVDEQFFKPVEKKDNYGYSRGVEPSWFMQEVKVLAEETIKTKTAEWFDNNKCVVDKAMETLLKPEVLTSFVMHSLIKQYSDDSIRSFNTVVERLNQLEQRR